MDGFKRRYDLKFATFGDAVITLELELLTHKHPSRECSLRSIPQRSDGKVRDRGRDQSNARELATARAGATAEPEGEASFSDCLLEHVRPDSSHATCAYCDGDDDRERGRRCFSL